MAKIEMAGHVQGFELPTGCLMTAVVILMILVATIGAFLLAL